MKFHEFVKLGRIIKANGRFRLDPDQPLGRRGIVALFEDEIPRYVMDGEIQTILAWRHPHLETALVAGRRVDLLFRDMPEPMEAAFTAQDIYSRMPLDWQPRRSP